jgi:hypothetical protein
MNYEDVKGKSTGLYRHYTRLKKLKKTRWLVSRQNIEIRNPNHEARVVIAMI